MNTAQRRETIGEWMAPTAILLALPKCPACLATYVALGTGFQIPISTAAYLHFFLIVICAASLTFLPSEGYERSSRAEKWTEAVKIRCGIFRAG